MPATKRLIAVDQIAAVEEVCNKHYHGCMVYLRGGKIITVTERYEDIIKHIPKPEDYIEFEFDEEKWETW